MTRQFSESSFSVSGVRYLALNLKYADRLSGCIAKIVKPFFGGFGNLGRFP